MRAAGCRLLFGSLLLCFVNGAGAQTADPIFLKWRWNPETFGPRVGGLAGAFVTTAQGEAAVLESPACLTFAGQEVSASFGSRAGLSFLGRGMAGGRDFAWGLRIGRTLGRTISANGVEVGDGPTIDFGRVAFTANSLTGAIAKRHRVGFREHHGFSAGLALTVSTLGVEGTYSVYRPSLLEESRIAYGLKNKLGDHLQTSLAASFVYEWGNEYTVAALRLAARGESRFLGSNCLRLTSKEQWQ